MDSSKVQLCFEVLYFVKLCCGLLSLDAFCFQSCCCVVFWVVELCFVALLFCFVVLYFVVRYLFVLCREPPP